MGKVATSKMKRTTNNTPNNNNNNNNNYYKKKKGRPSLLDLQKRSLIPTNQKTPTPTTTANTNNNHHFISSNSNPDYTSNSTPFRRSTRRNPIPDDIVVAVDDDYDDDDDDERKEKKVKLVVRLPQLNHQHFPSNSPSPDSSADEDNSNQGSSVKKRKINDGSDHFTPDQVQKVSKAMDTLHGSPLESGPTTPLPDKKLLVFILDRLQKKDTYGVFSEPVDPDELPDYHEIIEHPMDFGTVRKKLDGGLYPNLEELEADVLLICSNAMQYNAPDTIYFRQARSIQELAKRDFDNLKQEGEDGESRPKVVRRGRPPTKNLKKPLARPPVDHVGPEFSSVATLTTGADDTTGSNSYNLRRGPMLYRYGSTDALFAPIHSISGENGTEWVSDWNNEFPASILKADMKYGKKQFSYPLDENKRDTYKQFHPLTFGHEISALTNPVGDVKQLMAVGLHLEHGFARSLARFAANLGPTAWKVASKKIECVLPPGLKFGPGWVGDNEASEHVPNFPPDKCKSLDNLTFDGLPSQPGNALTAGMNSVVMHRDPLPCKEEMAQTVGRLNSQSDMAVPRSGVSGVQPWLPYQNQHKPVLHPDRNGVNGMFGYDLSSQMGRVRPATPTQSGQREPSIPSQILCMASKCDVMAAQPASLNNIGSEESKLSTNSSIIHAGNLSGSETGFSGHNPHPASEVGLSGEPSWQALPMHNRQYSLSGPPDLNVLFQSPGSPSSNLQIGSPQQPDLALQL